MRRRAAWVAAAVALSLAGVAPAQGADHLAARVWVTTPDRAELLAEQAPVSFGRARSDQPTIVVDPTQTYQSIDGFGAAITDSSASVLYSLPPAARLTAMRSLFSRTDGIGVSFLRQPIGSSDFTAEQAHYSMDDVPNDYA